MDDLAARCRTVSATGEASRLLGEAADRIDALQAALRKIADANHPLALIAEEALPGGFIGPDRDWEGSGF